VGAGICDVSSRSLSSVYFYFDPEHCDRGLGTWSILREIGLARELQLAYYYLGYWIEGCSKMAYKAAFGPHEILQPWGEWQRGEESDRTVYNS
jgi:leucyl-tRNA---protein transferase